MTSTSGDPDDGRLKGLRVFIVEDEATIALLLEDMLLDLGCEIAGCVGRVDAACELARSEAMDVAILDVNVAGETIAPVVDILTGREIPFVFSTGYGSSGLEERFRGKPVLDKPFTQDDLCRRLRSALGLSA